MSPFPWHAACGAWVKLPAGEEGIVARVALPRLYVHVFLSEEGPWLSLYAEAGGCTPLDEPTTRAVVLGEARRALREPTLHPRPGHGGWYIERETASGDHEWLHVDGHWGEWPSNVIWERTEMAALLAAWTAAQAVVKAGATRGAAGSSSPPSR